MNARIVGLCGMNRYSWKWNLADLKQDKDVTVFSTFSCGGVAQWATNAQDSKSWVT